MPKSDLINLELFVASPGDVSKERQKVVSVITELEHTIGSILEINIRPFLWEYDLGPGAHPKGPQGLVDAHSNLEKSDILVGIFWNRLGTPTPDGKTGTEHEFWIAYNRWKNTGKPHIMLYFSDKPIVQTQENLSQASLLQNFKKSLPEHLLYWRYKHPQDFESQFRQHLTRHIMQVWSERGRPIDPIRFAASSGLKLGLIESGPALIETNSDLVSEAEEIFFATGSRGRDEGYFRAVEKRLKDVPRLIHYRVLMGMPFRPLLKDHLHRLLDLRSPEDRSLGFKTLHLGIFEKLKRQAEVFIAGNEKRVLIVLPSRKGVGEYNSALVIDDEAFVNDMQRFVKQLYTDSRVIETHEAVEDLALTDLIG